MGELVVNSVGGIWDDERHEWVVPLTQWTAVRACLPVLTRRLGPSSQRYKLARYYDAEGKVADQWEMYDLKTDPLERTNLAFKHYKRNARQQREYRRLRRKLAQVEQTRLQPLS